MISNTYNRYLWLLNTLLIYRTEKVFDYPIDFSPERYYKDIVGIWTNEKCKVEKVIIRAYGKQAKYLRTLPLHSSQEEIVSVLNYTDFKYNLCITNNLVNELLAKGSSVEVLEPASLRKRMQDELFTMIRRYKKITENNI